MESSSLSSSAKKGVQESTVPCEVCGNVGIADSIMICLACRDTREHTYCARVLLPYVPPFWICEACRFSSRVLLVPHIGKNLVDSLDPKKSNKPRQEDQETNNHIEEVVGDVTYLSQDLSFGLAIESVFTMLFKETASVSNETCQDKEQHQQSQDFLRKHKKLRLMEKQTLVSPLDQSLTDKC
ncbi:unnamed protein product [Cochlearia groenlandica]